MSAAAAHAHGHSHSHHGHSHQGHDHGHDHGGHGHNHAPEVTPQNERVVLIGFLLTFGFMFAEIIGGVLSGSLALIADAGHMMTDAAALALAWAGFRFGRRAADSKRTFGYMRFEVLAGFVNALALILLVAWIAYEAVLRLLDPSPVLAGPMMIVAVLGLAVNCGVFYMLNKGDKDHVNIKGAMLHVVGDMLGSVAAIVAAGVIWMTGWTPVDPILSVLLSALVLRSGWGLLKNSMHILMEGAPSGLDPEAMRKGLVDSVPGLADVSHIHVWSITSGRSTATMHIALSDAADPAETVRLLKGRLAEEFEIGHSTVEIDWAGTKAACSMGTPLVAKGHGHDHGDHDHAGHDHSGHDHSGHDHSGHAHGAHDHGAHDHAGHDHSDHDHAGHDHAGHDHGDHAGHDHAHDHAPAAKPRVTAKAHDHGAGGCGHAH